MSVSKQSNQRVLSSSGRYHQTCHREF